MSEIQRAARDLSRLFQRGIIPASNPHFNVRTLPDGRQSLDLKSIPVGVTTSAAKPPDPRTNQIVALIHFSSFDPDADPNFSIGLGLDTSDLRGGTNEFGPLAGYDVRAINADHPYAGKQLLGAWFGGMGNAIFLDSTKKNNFPDLTSLVATLDDPNEIGFTIEICKGGNITHSAGDVTNPTATILQSLAWPPSSGSPVVLTWDYSTNTASLSL